MMKFFLPRNDTAVDRYLQLEIAFLILANPYADGNNINEASFHYINGLVKLMGVKFKMPQMTIPEIREEGRSLARTHNVKKFVIDYAEKLANNPRNTKSWSYAMQRAQSMLTFINY